MKANTQDHQEALTLPQALDRFLIQLKADGRSVHTQKQYERHLRKFMNWALEKDQDATLDTLRQADVAAFFTSTSANVTRTGIEKSPASVNALRTSLRCFFDFCHAAEWSSHNPARLLRRAHTRPKAPRPVGGRDKELLLQAVAEPESFEEERDRMLLQLLLGAGLRIGSTIALDIVDIDLESAELRLRKQKGGGESLVLLSARVVEELRAFLRGRTSGPLFCNRLGRRITIRQAQRRFAALLEKSGIARKHSLHALRHTFATELYEKTGDIHLVQTAMGHRSIESTLIYARCDRERLRQAL